MKKCWLFLIILMLSGCTQVYGPDFKYTWKVKVIYTDSSIDTLDCSYASFKGNDVNIYLNSSSGDAFHAGSNSPCLKISCGFYDSVITCGVRKFEILSFKKINPENANRQ